MQPISNKELFKKMLRKNQIQENIFNKVLTDYVICHYHGNETNKKKTKILRGFYFKAMPYNRSVRDIKNLTNNNTQF